MVYDHINKRVFREIIFLNNVVRYINISRELNRMLGNVIRRIRIMQRYSRYAWTNFYARVCVCVCIHTCYSQEIARARANLQWISPSFLFFFPVCRRSERRERKLEEKKKLQWKIVLYSDYHTN